MKRKYYIYVVIITLIFAVAAWVGEQGEAETETTVLARGEPGEGDREISLKVEVPKLQEAQDYQITLAERIYTEAEREALFQRAVQEIEEKFPAAGEETSHITKQVNLLSSAQDGLVDVTWSLGDAAVILEDGRIDAAKTTEEGTLVQVCALLSYQEYEYLYEFPVRVYPEEVDGIGQIVKKLDTYFDEQNTAKKESAEVELPQDIGGYTVNWSKEQSYAPLVIVGMGILVLFLLPLYEKEQAEKRRKERKMQLEMDYPGMLTEFSLLLGAGMTIRAVWEKVVQAYDKQLATGRRRRSELYEQMRMTYRYIQDGAGEMNAYEQFARGCETACCRRFSMLLTQHLEKGTAGLAKTLELEANQAFEERKSLARRRGEEAGTKLLFPMLLMLLVVMVIMLVPACMTMDI